jgi:hypothetical protein
MAGLFSNWTKRLRKQESEKKMGLTKKQRDERAAVKAGTHERTTDDFGNPYLKPLPAKPKQYVCVHCGQRAVEISGKQITPGLTYNYKHAPGEGKGCPRAWGPLEDDDVREA